MVNVVVILGCKRRLPLSKDKETKDKQTNKKETQIDESHHMYSRLKKGLEVYNSIKDPEKFIICSGGIGEAESMKEFLLTLNNKQDKNIELKIMLENQSLNTIENCVYTYNLLKSWYFSEPQLDARSKEGLSLHLSDFLSENEEKDKIKDIDLQNLTIHLVTNDYHIKRSEIIFNHFKERLPITPQIVCYPANILDYLPSSSPSAVSREVLEAIEDSKRRDLVSLMNIEDALKHYK